MAQVPRTADGRLSADAVARSLGLHHGATTAALGRLFAGCGAPAPAAVEMTETVGPRQAGGHEEGAHSGQTGAAGEAAPAFRAEQVEQGLGRLLAMLATPGATGMAETVASCPSGAAARPATAPAPTTRQYWQARADAVVPPDVARSWALLERQTAQQLAALPAAASAGLPLGASSQQQSVAAAKGQASRGAAGQQSGGEGESEGERSSRAGQGTAANELALAGGQTWEGLRASGEQGKGGAAQKGGC